MEDIREIILEKLESAFRDMDAHSYNNYADNSEYSVIFTVKELRWLYSELREDNDFYDLNYVNYL